MHLTSVLYRWKKALPGGHLWRGKYRLYREVKPKHLKKLKLEFDQEEQNMFYLRHPYIPIEVSYGHATALGKHKQFIDKQKSRRTWYNNTYLGDRLGYLKISEQWEK